VLELCPHLTVLHLRGCSIGGVGLSAILEKLITGHGKSLVSLQIHGGSTRPEVWSRYIHFLSTPSNVPRLALMELPELAASKQAVKAANKAGGPGSYAEEKMCLLNGMTALMAKRRELHSCSDSDSGSGSDSGSDSER
jgi:hypothetical protein